MTIGSIKALKMAIDGCNDLSKLTHHSDRGIQYCSYNYVDIGPPAGYNMSHLVGFLPSIAEISFAGAVNGDDTLFCQYVTDSEKIRVICANSEIRYSSRINWIAIWIKY